MERSKRNVPAGCSPLWCKLKYQDGEWEQRSSKQPVTPQYQPTAQ
jgi:hypothetical protein